MTRLTLALLGTLMALTAGCATTTPRVAEPRLVASDSRLVLEVEGEGTVELGGSACSEARCQLEWEKVADPVLTAEAAPGWRFERWEAPAGAPSSLDDPSQPRVYRAVFRRAEREVARR